MKIIPAKEIRQHQQSIKFHQEGSCEKDIQNSDGLQRPVTIKQKINRIESILNDCKILKSTFIGFIDHAWLYK